ncbi:MAG: response regulator [Magnetococcales bacterium]|nr:response regulator [Magnetococcales bacterium]
MLDAHFERVFRLESASDEIQVLYKRQEPVHCLLESSLTHDPVKNQPLCLTVAFDISKRKQAENQIAELAERNNRILDSAAEGIIGVDDQRRIIFSNPSAAGLLGWSPEELLGKDIRRVLRPQHSSGNSVEQKDDPVIETLQDGKSRSVLNGYLIRRKGTRFPASFTVSPTFNEKGVSGLVFTFRDDTERREIEASLKTAKYQAERANQAKSAFLATMSHEIRTPMNAIIGMADFVEETTSQDERSEAMSIIKESGQSLLTLINDILDLAKIESGEVELEHEVYSTRDLIESVRSIMHYPATVQKKLKLETYVNSDVPMAILGDFRRIRQILINLVGNAIKFTNSGQIVISVITNSTKGNKILLQFSVKDTGIGISEDRLEDIFKNFVQADRTTNQKYGGTGLGLAISQRLVQAMGGKIWVESATGKGSEFLFSIPTEIDDIENSEEYQQQEQSRIKMAARDKYQETTPKIASIIPKDSRILLAEDDPINQLVLLKIFNRMGLVPDLAQNGLQALEMASLERYDLIFMDVQMPEMDGLTAVKKLRAREKSDGHEHHTSVVALTAFALDGDEEMCIKAGMDDYLCKPINSTDLQRVLCRWIGDEAKAATLNKKGSFSTEILIDKNRFKTLYEEVGLETFDTIVHVSLLQIKELSNELQEVVDQGNFKSIESIAHKLKGSCLQIGALALCNIANDLERLARAELLEEIKLTASTLEETVNESCVGIEMMINEIVV